MSVTSFLEIPSQKEKLTYHLQTILLKAISKKRWKIIDGEHILLKSGNNPHRFEVFNEVIASSLMDRLGIVHTKYDLLWIGDGPCCSCKNFITPSTDLVTAYHIQRMQKRPDNRSVYDHYVKCCSDIDIDIIPSLDRMIVSTTSC